MIGKKAKIYAKVLLEVVEGKSKQEAEKIVKNLLLLLRKRGDIRLGFRVVRELQNLEEEKEGKPGLVVSAKPLYAELKQRLENSLSKKGFAMKESVHPSVMGGLAIFLGREYMIDGTVRGKLSKLAKSLNFEL